MPKHTCILCNKVFNRKSNYNYNVEHKKNPCIPSSIKIVEKYVIVPPESSAFPPESSAFSSIEEELILQNPVIINVDNDNNFNTNITCIYCGKIFTRIDNLQRHQSTRCKSKVKQDEL
jgi:hypothetical protein